MNTWYIGIAYSSIFLACFICIEYIVRKINVNREITRRIAHVLSSLFGLVMGMVMEKPVFIFMCLFFFAMITISLRARLFSFIHNVRRKTYGEVLLPLGILASYLVANEAMIVFIISVLILAIADPIAGIIGDVLSRTYALRTMAFFILALSILLFTLPPGEYVMAVLIASIITIVERISPLGSDNLTIPLTSSILLSLLLQS